MTYVVRYHIGQYSGTVRTEASSERSAIAQARHHVDRVVVSNRNEITTYEVVKAEDDDLVEDNS